MFFVKLILIVLCIWSLIKSSSVISKLLLNTILNMTRAWFHNSHHQQTFSTPTFFCIWSLIKSSNVISNLLLNIILNMMACYCDLGLVVWCGLVWTGVAWCGFVWSGVGWCGLVWFGVDWCGLVWVGLAWCGLVWPSVDWCGPVRKTV